MFEDGESKAGHQLQSDFRWKEAKDVHEGVERLSKSYSDNAREDMRPVRDEVDMQRWWWETYVMSYSAGTSPLMYLQIPPQL